MEKRDTILTFVGDYYDKALITYESIKGHEYDPQYKSQVVIGQLQRIPNMVSLLLPEDLLNIPSSVLDSPKDPTEIRGQVKQLCKLLKPLGKLLCENANKILSRIKDEPPFITYDGPEANLGHKDTPRTVQLYFDMLKSQDMTMGVLNALAQATNDHFNRQDMWPYMSLSGVIGVKPRQFADWVNVRTTDMENVQFVSNDCAVCGAHKPHYKCGRCKWTKYCSRDCQASDWKSHKPKCKVFRQLKIDDFRAGEKKESE